MKLIQKQSAQGRIFYASDETRFSFQLQKRRQRLQRRREKLGGNLSSHLLAPKKKFFFRQRPPGKWGKQSLKENFDG